MLLSWWIPWLDGVCWSDNEITTAKQTYPQALGKVKTFPSSSPFPAWGKDSLGNTHAIHLNILKLHIKLKLLTHGGILKFYNKIIILKLCAFLVLWRKALSFSSFEVRVRKFLTKSGLIL